MKSISFIPILASSVLVSWFVWSQSPLYIRQGGPLLVIGLACLFLVFTFCLERMLVFWRAGGRGNVTTFVANLKKVTEGGDLEQAVESCRRQGGSLGNVIGAGLERYHARRRAGADQDEVIAETREVLDEASALESPILGRNLNVLATIASIATMVGLLGTTVGMIRAFRAMSRGGAPDATQLAVGISEALVNTALGLMTAILAIVLYNYFTQKADSFTQAVDRTSYEMLQLLKGRKGSGAGRRVLRRQGVRIDMTPMVDVAFLLLIFFMTTTQFKPPERVSVVLPTSRSEIHVPETNTIIFTVNKNGQVFVSTENVAETQEVAQEDLLAAITAWRSQNPGAVVILKGDRDADFGVVANLMDALADSKTLRFNLMTDLKQKKPPAEGAR
jgi:biopolymer transport protein ExbB